MKKDPRYSSHIPDTPLLQAEHLSVAYEAGVGLEDVSFQLSAGERVAVVGPNGAGKSTLFKVIAGVIRPDRGSLRIYGSEPGRHTCIAYLAQHQQVDWNFPVTVEDVVMMGRTRRIGFMGWPGSRDRHIVKHALETVGLEELSGRQISQLSGGQQQRMFIAGALAQEAELVLMDEPVTGLDTPSQEELFKVLDLLEQSTEARDRVEANTKYFRDAMTGAGFTIGGKDHPISPVMLGDAVLSQKFSAQLLDEGVYAVGFFYPVVPKGQARIRTQISAAHTREQLDKGGYGKHWFWPRHLRHRYSDDYRHVGDCQ